MLRKANYCWFQSFHVTRCQWSEYVYFPRCQTAPLTLEHLWKLTQLVFEKHLTLLKCEQVQHLYSTLVVHVSLYVKTYFHSSRVAVSTHCTYTTELSSNSHAAKSCAHLLQPYKRASSRGLRVRSALYQAMCMYIQYVLVSFCFLERRGLQALPVSWPISVSQFWSSWGLPGDHLGLPHVTDLSVAMVCCHFWMFGETAVV